MFVQPRADLLAGERGPSQLKLSHNAQTPLCGSLQPYMLHHPSKRVSDRPGDAKQNA